MISVNFKLAPFNTKKRIEGILTHIAGKGGSIMFNAPVCGSWKHEVKEKGEIKNQPDFIAAFIRNLDKDGLYEKITINRKSTLIKRSTEKKEVSAIVLGNLAIASDALDTTMATVTDMYGNTAEVPLVDIINAKINKPVLLPADKKYCKNPFVNAVLLAHSVSIEHSKKVAKLINDEYGNVKNWFSEGNTTDYYIGIDNFTRTWVSSGDLELVKRRCKFSGHTKIFTITQTQYELLP